MQSKFILILCFSFSLLQAKPFSVQEINAIPDFTLTKPEFVTATDGVKLAYYPFANSRSQKIVILYAGAGLYGNKTYQWVAKTLHEKYGIGCYIFDIRGHGHSQGERGDGPSIEQVVRDVATAVTLVKKNHEQSKIYLAGHSAGAGLLINFAASKTDVTFDGYIFIAPYLGPKSDALKEHKDAQDSFVKSIRTWVYILGTMFPNSLFIHWNAVFFNYSAKLLAKDPLIVAAYTYVMSMATTPYELPNLMKKIDKPTAIFIGTDDEQFIPERVLKWAELIQAPVQLELISGAKHLSILLQTPELIDQYLK